MGNRGSLASKVVVITGSVGGLGAATALLAADHGATVVAVDVFPEDDPRVATLLSDLSSDSSYVSCDITKGADVAETMDAIVARYRRLDGAVNLAGVFGENALTADWSDEIWRHVIDVNLFGTWLCLKHELRIMSEKGAGSIVNVASTAGHRGEAKRSAYAASKAGIISLTKTAAIEYASHGIRVNVVSPGPFDGSAFHKSVGAPDSREGLDVIGALPISRLGYPSEFAEIVVWLLSDSSSFVVGHDLVVDGGLTAK